MSAWKPAELGGFAIVTLLSNSVTQYEGGHDA